MKNLFKNFAAGFMSVIIVGSVLYFPGTANKVNASTKVDGFIGRLYQVTLDRSASTGEINYWASEINEARQTGVSTAYNFIFSPEFQSKAISDEQYVIYMYQAFMGREPGSDEISYWVNEGLSRENLFAGFANSNEFDGICKEAGIISGCYLPGYNVQQTINVNLFVNRLYNDILSRSCDASGMLYWTRRLLDRQISGTEAAYSFVFSNEYCSRNRSDEEFVRDLYTAFMGREADDEGLAYWEGRLLIPFVFDKTIFAEFANSSEFAGICAGYGIDVGTSISGGTLSARQMYNPYFRWSQIEPVDESHKYAYAFAYAPGIIGLSRGTPLYVANNDANNHWVRSDGSYVSALAPYRGNTTEIKLELRFNNSGVIPCHYVWYYSPTGNTEDAAPLSSGYMTINAAPNSPCSFTETSRGAGTYYIFITDTTETYIYCEAVTEIKAN